MCLSRSEPHFCVVSPSHEERTILEIWSDPSKSDLRTWQAGCLNLYKFLLPCQLRESHLSSIDICRLAHMPAPSVLIRFERLRLLSQLAGRGFQALLQLLESAVGNPHCWLSAASKDLDWLVSLRPTPTAVSLLDRSWPALLDCLRQRPALMSSLLRSAWGVAVCRVQSSDILAFEPIQNGCVQCPQCGFKAKDKRGLHTHLAIRHGRKIEARYFARGRQCEACMKLFANRARLVKHWSKSSPSCLQFMRTHRIPMTPDEERAVTKQASKLAKVPRAADLCKAFVSDTAVAFEDLQA